MATEESARQTLRPSEETLATVQSAWDTLFQLSLVGKLFDIFKTPQRHDSAEQVAEASRELSGPIAEFRDRLQSLERLLFVNQQERVLRWIYRPNNVTSIGNRLAPFNRHSSYSMAVWDYSSFLFAALPWQIDPLAPLAVWERSPGSELPMIDFTKFTVEYLFAADRDSGKRFQSYVDITSKVLARWFEIDDLRVSLRREYAAVADEIGAERDAPLEYSIARSPSNWEWVFSECNNPLNWRRGIKPLIDDGTLVIHPNGTSKSIQFESISLAALIPKYKDSLPSNKSL